MACPAIFQTAKIHSSGIAERRLLMENRIRVSPQAYYYIGSLGVISEYAQVIQDVSLTTGGSPAAGGAGFQHEYHTEYKQKVTS